MRLRAVLAVMISALLIVGLSARPSAAEPAAELDTSQVQTFISDYLDRNGLPGATVAVTKDGKSVFESGIGHDSAGAPLTEDSRLRIGSVSKSFTAFAVLTLVADGKLDLDQPLKEALPEFEVDDPRGSKITIRQLLSQTSGLATPTIIPPAQTLEEGVARTAAWPLSAAPGERFQYSNANYWVAARLVEKASGVPFGDFLDAKVFKPLGMNDSVATVNSTDPVPGLAAGHVTAYGGALRVTELEAMDAGAGSVISTSRDMAKWLSMQSNDGRLPDGTSLLPADLIRESHTPQPSAGRYGLGWYGPAPGTKPVRVSHSGAVSGFQSQQTIYPQSGYAVAVLLNSFTTPREHAYEIEIGIMAIADGKTPPEIGLPIPTLIDFGLAIVSLGILALGARGVLRSPAWVDKRRTWRMWRFGLRLLPQLIIPVFAGWLFLVVPTLQDNSATIADVFGLYPAAAILIMVWALVGLAVTASRVFQRARAKLTCRSRKLAVVGIRPGLRLI